MKQTKNSATLLLFIGWLVYSTSYLGKVNYSANITQIIDFYGVTKAEAGLAPTFFFFAYGIGQVVNGLLCKKFNIKYVIFSSLFTSGLLNLVIAVSSNFAIVKWLWLVNGFILSLLWPSLIRLMSECLSKKSLGRSSVVLGTTVASGTLIIYLLSSIYALFDHFKLSFYTAAGCDILVAIIWLFVFKKAVNKAKIEKDNENIEDVKTRKVQFSQVKTNHRLVLTMLGFLCVFAVGINLVKDGLNTWVPSILKESYGMADSLAIFLTLFLPIVALFGNAFSLMVHKRIPDYITNCCVVFATMGLIIGLIVWSMNKNWVIVMLLGIIATSFLASSLNSLITSIFPLFMRESINSGRTAGIINGFCYLGSTISSYGLGSVAQNFGWSSVFLLLILFCGLFCLLWFIYLAIKKYITR